MLTPPFVFKILVVVAGIRVAHERRGVILSLKSLRIVESRQSCLRHGSRFAEIAGRPMFMGSVGSSGSLCQAEI
jgi:hypothetical protein